MLGRLRREKVPDDIKAAIDLAATERVIAAARRDDQSHVVATDRALYLVSTTLDNESAEVTARLRWDLIDKATWEPPLLALNVRDSPDSEVVSVLVAIDTDAELPAVVRECVTNSIVVNSRIEVPGGSARVVARRNPDDGILSWRVVLSEGVSPNDPTVRAAADQELAELRSTLGV